MTKNRRWRFGLVESVRIAVAYFGALGHSSSLMFEFAMIAVSYGIWTRQPNDA
jgi:hypothetical protein